MNIAQIIIAGGTGVATALGVILMFYIAVTRSRLRRSPGSTVLPSPQTQRHSESKTISYRTRRYDYPELEQTDMDLQRRNDTVH